MRKVIITTLIIVFFVLQPTSCFAVDGNQVEAFLSEFRPEKVQGRSFEEVKESYKLVETRDETGGIIAYDIAENGNIAVITGEREFLTIYDGDMNIIGQYNPRLYMEGIKYLDDYILIFTTYDTCAVYDQNMELISIYDIVTETESASPYEKYESIARETIKRRGDYTFYISDRVNKPPSISLGWKHQYNYLIRVDENGEQSVLLDRNDKRIVLIIFLTCVAAAIVLVVAVIRKRLNHSKK